MGELITACVLAGRDLLRPGMLIHALWPPLVALVGWTMVAIQVWAPAREYLQNALPDWNWLTQTFLADWIANIALMLAFAPFVYFTTLVLTTAFALPRMMTVVAASDYPDLERLGRGALWGSIANSLIAGAVYVIGWLVTLPLLLIPGVLLIMPGLWTAWLNQRTFRFDALAEHATKTERYLVIRDGRSVLYAAGGVSAVLAHIPFINLLVPAWTALLYVHLCLLRLRKLRKEGAVWDQEIVQ